MNAGDDLAMLLRVTGSLVAVVALALLAARFARRGRFGGGSTGLQVRERVGLTRESSVAVVEVAGRLLVVGVTAHAVSLLTELDGAALPPEPELAAPARSWRELLDAWRDRTVRR